MLEVTILSVLQGIAEFLPISSSGHLVLGKSLLGLGECGMRLDIFLHVGTLAAVFAFYASTVLKLLRGMAARDGESWMYAFKVVLSAVPAAVVGLAFKDQVETAFASPQAVGCALLFTGAVLSATRFLPRGGGEVTVWKAVLMGLAQAVAILPGVSRSGMTLAAARAARVEAGRSAEFSFLMSAPPIAGAALLETLKCSGASSSTEVSWGLCAFGAALSAVVGYGALKLLLKSLKGGSFWLFGPYCFLAGAVTILCA